MRFKQKVAFWDACEKGAKCTFITNHAYNFQKQIGAISRADCAVATGSDTRSEVGVPGSTPHFCTAFPHAVWCRASRKISCST